MFVEDFFRVPILFVFSKKRPGGLGNVLGSISKKQKISTLVRNTTSNFQFVCFYSFFLYISVLEKSKTKPFLSYRSMSILFKDFLHPYCLMLDCWIQRLKTVSLKTFTNAMVKLL